MTFELVVLTLAAAQAFLLALLIFQKHRALFANRFLAVMMLACGLAMIHILVQDYGLYDAAPELLYLVLGIPFLVGPLHFLYTKYLLSRSTSMARRDRLHFVSPVAVELVAVLIALLFPASLSLPRTNNVALVPPLFHVYNWVLLACGVTYTLASLRLLIKYNRTTKKVVSSLENVRLNWLMFLTLAALAAWLEFLTESAFLLFGINLSNFVATSVCGALYIYAIGYYGLLKSEVLTVPATVSTMHEIFEAAAGESDVPAKYERSGLDEDAAADLAERLAGLMDKEKPYTRPSLTLTELASMLSVTPHNLSEVINTRFRRNFYDFINGYRVEQVKRDLGNPANKNLKILSIALDAGFNSKASFNGVFKAVTKLTPSEFRKQALETSANQRAEGSPDHSGKTSPADLTERSTDFHG